MLILFSGKITLMISIDYLDIIQDQPINIISYIDIKLQKTQRCVIENLANPPRNNLRNNKNNT